MCDSHSLTMTRFTGDLRRTLHHLYDPAELRNSSLARLFAIDPHEDAALALRRLLLEAIEALQPAAKVPAQSSEWRHYYILLHRFAEQFTQKEVANDLGLSIRQLRRQEQRALKELAGYLWTHHRLAGKVKPQGRVDNPVANDAPAAQAATISREQELAWSQQSFPSELAQIGEIFHTVIQTVQPLATHLQVHITFSCPDHLPQLAVQVMTVRQALVSALTTAIRRVPGGRITITAGMRAHEAWIQILGEDHTAGPVRSGDENGVEALKMAQELVGFSGGRLDIRLGEDGPAAVMIRMTLPTEAQVTVLAIDDNPDTLALFQRFTAGTRYHLVGVREPEQALKLAAELQPQLIVLDVMLPGIDGWELLGRLRAHPQIGGVPVIVCTILPQEQLALTLGAAAFLRKPLSRTLFLAMLDAQTERLR